MRLVALCNLSCLVIGFFNTQHNQSIVFCAYRDLIFIWSKLQLKSNPSKQVFVDQCYQLLRIATNVRVIFPFMKVIKDEVSSVFRLHLYSFPPYFVLQVNRSNIDVSVEREERAGKGIELKALSGSQMCPHQFFLWSIECFHDFFLTQLCQVSFSSFLTAENLRNGVLDKHLGKLLENTWNKCERWVAAVFFPHSFCVFFLLSRK